MLHIEATIHAVNNCVNIPNVLLINITLYLESDRPYERTENYFLTI